MNHINFFVVFYMLISACSSIIPDAASKNPEASDLESLVIPSVTIPPAEPASATTIFPTLSRSEPINKDPSATQTEVYLPNIPSSLDPSQYTWVPVAAGLNQPVDLTHPGDGSGRLFIVERPGLIRILLNGLLMPEPFLNIQDRVGSGGSEQGLLGLAFHPAYLDNGYFFVNYTNLNGDTIISRFQRSEENPELAEPGSEKIILQISQPYKNHNGGGIVFGPDGYLYIGTGDGGSGGDPLGNGQSLDTLLGKILRIDVDNGNSYAIPPDNPYVDSPGRPEIWAYGLRNPWRFSFDKQTGDLFIADVGQNNWEEINYTTTVSTGGENYGWNYFEGNHIFTEAPPDNLELTPPIAEYSHQSGCSVTGGFVYRGEQLPGFYGVYIFGDFCSGNVWGLIQEGEGNWQQKLLFETTARISSFGMDQFNEIYMLDLSGSVLKLQQK